jgi:hypothetical protein
MLNLTLCDAWLGKTGVEFSISAKFGTDAKLSNT